MKAKLMALNVPASDPQASRSFYAALLGTEFARSYTEDITSYHCPLADDLLLWISHRLSNDEKIAAVFAVDNLDAAVAELRGAGGQQFGGPFESPISPKLLSTYRENRAHTGAPVTNTMGKYSLVKDPDNNIVAIMQVEEHAHEFFKLGKYAAPMSAKKIIAHQQVIQVGKQLELERPPRG
jgi:predicted enzyme related to lactoylglutathione lyase